MKPKVCEIHGVALEKAEVPVTYGLTSHVIMPVKGEPGRFRLLSVKDYAEVKMRLFPNARRFVNGGCTMGDKQFAEVDVCPECQRAERQWWGQ